MIATGQASAAVPHTHPLPVPTTPRTIAHRPHRRGLDWGTHTAPAIDPDAIARLQRQGLLTVTDAVINERPVKVVKKAKRRKKAPEPRTYATGRRPPKFDVAAVIEAYENKVSLRQLATLHGCSRDTIRYHLTQAGVKIERRDNSRPFTAEEIERATGLYLSGMTLKEVGTAIGRSPAGVHEALRGAGVQMRHYSKRRAS